MIATLLGVGEKEWAFKTTFVASNDDLKAPNADLVFDGLDTFATVTLVRSNIPSSPISSNRQITEWYQNFTVRAHQDALVTGRVLNTL